jgi:hypothetical protein
MTTQTRDHDGAEMWELLEAIEPVVESADPTKREALSLSGGRYSAANGRPSATTEVLARRVAFFPPPTLSERRHRGFALRIVHRLQPMPRCTQARAPSAAIPLVRHFRMNSR